MKKSQNKTTALDQIIHDKLYNKEAVARKIIESNKRMGIVEQPSSLPKKNSNTNKKKY